MPRCTRESAFPPPRLWKQARAAHHCLATEVDTGRAAPAPHLELGPGGCPASAPRARRGAAAVSNGADDACSGSYGPACTRDSDAGAAANRRAALYVPMLCECD